MYIGFHKSRRGVLGIFSYVHHISFFDDDSDYELNITFLFFPLHLYLPL